MNISPMVSLPTFPLPAPMPAPAPASLPVPVPPPDPGSFIRNQVHDHAWVIAAVVGGLALFGGLLAALRNRFGHVRP